MGSRPIPQRGSELITPIWHPSPNFGERRDGATPALIVIHYTAMASAEAALERLCDPEAEVSAHYLIGRDGVVWHMVEEQARAWHAGAGSWRGQPDVNSRSIGIELDNSGRVPFAEPLMVALEVVLAGVMSRWSIPADGVIGHSDMAPGRKHDPGARFDWQRLARQGLAQGSSYAPVAGTGDPEAFRAAAQQVGYPDDVPDEALLNAVRLRHRPWAEGPLCAADVAVLKDYAQRSG